MFKKLDSILKEKFGYPGTEGKVTFWHKGFTIVIKSLYEEKAGRLGIKIEFFNTKTFPVKMIWENYH